MAKKGMARPDRTHTKEKNTVPSVPELQGKAKHTKEKANPIISDTAAPQQNVFHGERPIPADYPVLDTDLGRDNVENDLPTADLEDL